MPRPPLDTGQGVSDNRTRSQGEKSAAKTARAGSCAWLGDPKKKNTGGWTVHVVPSGGRIFNTGSLITG